MHKVTLPPTALVRDDFRAINLQVLSALKQRLHLQQNVIDYGPDGSYLLPLSDELFGGYMAQADTLLSPVGVYYGQIQFHPLEIQQSPHTWTITQCFEKDKPIIHVDFRAPGTRELVPLTLDQEIIVENASRRTKPMMLLDHLVQQSRSYK